MNRLAAILMAAYGTLAVSADPPLPGDGFAFLFPKPIRSHRKPHHGGIP